MDNARFTESREIYANSIIALMEGPAPHSHSIVPGGFEVMS
jgi:hypothetical protein